MPPELWLDAPSQIINPGYDYWANLSTGGAVLNGRGLSPWALDLDFMSGVLDPRITFSRASLATMFDSSGRLVYAPHNLLSFSENMTGSEYTRAGAVLPTITANAALAPDGTNTANLIQLGSAADARIGCTPTVQINASGFSTTFSVWLRAESGQSGTVSLPIRRSDGTVVNTVVSVTDQWQRFSATASPAIGASTAVVWCGNIGFGSTALTTYYAWGLQIELHASMRPYLRTSGAAYHGPRFGFDPVTLQPLGLQIEAGGRVNTCLWSNDLSNAVWGRSQMSLPATPTVTGKDGNQVRPLVPNTVTTAHTIQQTVATGVGLSTISFLAKSGGVPVVGFRENTTTGVAAAFNLVNGAVVAGSGGSARMVDVGGGWWLCSLEISFTTAISRLINFSALDNAFAFPASPHNYTWTGDGTSALYLDAVQVEVGTGASSRIPTSGAAITRAAESCTIQNLNSASWFNQSAGTFLMEYQLGPLAVNNASLAISDGSSNNQVAHIVGGSSRSGLFHTTAGTATFAPQNAGVILTPFAENKAAWSYAASGKKISSQGSAVASDAIAPPVAGYTVMSLGASFGGANPLQGFLRRIRYAGNANFSDAELQSLSS